jgi:hypothetical protein
VNPKLIKHAEWIVAILLSATVLFVLFVRATHAGPLWRDEAATVQLAQLPTPSDITANFQHEAFPLPFPLLIRTYAALFGASDASLRWFGFIVGVAVVAAAWFNSRAVGDRAPLLFLALVGLNATFLIWGTSLRGYGLGCVFLLLTLGLTAKAIRQPTTGNAVVATLASIASVQVMVNAVPLIAAIGTSAFTVFIFQRRFRQTTVVCACATICALSFLPYAKAYLGADWNVVVKYPTPFFSLWDKFRLALEEQGLLMAVFWYAAVPLIIFAAIWRWWTWRRDKSFAEAHLLLFLIAVSALSIFAYYTFLKILSYATRSWYYLPLLCAVAGAIDLMGGILARARWIRIARLLFAIAALLFLPFTLWKSAHERLTDIDLVAQKLQQDARASDLIVVNPWFLGISFNWYYHGATQWLTLPEIGEHRIHRFDLVKMKMMSPIPIDDVIDAMKQTLKSGNRVWLVGGAHMPQPGRAPLSLPPAPNSQFRWNADTYARAWSQQIAMFAQDHALRGEFPNPVGDPVNEFEKVPLWMIEGWRD